MGWRPDNEPMPVTARPSTSTDLARNLAVASLAVIQIVVAGMGGSGALGEDVGTVARSYPTPVLPAGWTFGIWGVIYLAFVGYAVYQLLPTQRTRAVHRATGWWLAVSAVLNMAWVATFSARYVLLAEVLLLALLAVLARVYGRLSRERAATTRSLHPALRLAETDRQRRPSVDERSKSTTTGARVSARRDFLPSRRGARFRLGVCRPGSGVDLS